MSSAKDNERSRRGVEFERLISDIFRRAHYRVKHDSSVAKPRQTDLLARSALQTFVIECKWRTRPTGVNHVDELRARLNRAPAGSIGILVSVADFAEPAVEEVASHRGQPILLFAREEVERLVDEPEQLPRMIAVKYDQLAVHATAHLIRAQNDQRRHRVTPAALAVSDDLLSIASGPVSWLTAPGDHSGVVFSLESTGWDARHGGVSFDLQLEAVQTRHDLQWALSELSALGWMTEEGSWSLQQANLNWHGFGARSLAEALDARPQRYRDAGPLHHTETLLYADSCDGGCYSLTADLDSRSEKVSYAEISMEFVGIPLERQPLEELARTFGVIVPPRFRPPGDYDVGGAVRPKQQTIVTPIGLVTHADPGESEIYVRGVVTDLSGLTLFDPGATIPHSIANLGTVICNVRDWHPISQPHTYELQRCLWTQCGSATVVQVDVSWPNSELPIEIRRALADQT